MQARWSPFVKQIVVVGSLAAMFWLLARLHVLLIPVILALLLAYLLSYPVRWILRNTGWPRTAAVAVVYLFVILILLTAPVLLSPRLMSLVTALGSTLRNVFIELSETTPKPIDLMPGLTLDLGPFYAPLNQWLTSVAQPDPVGPTNWQNLLFPFATSAVVVVRGAVTSVVWILFVLTVSFYLVKDAPTIGRFIASRIPDKLQPELERLWHELASIWDAFVRGQVLLGLTMGLLVWVVMAILGVRNAAALGLLSGVLEFVPAVGPPVAAAIGILIALVLGSTWLPLTHGWFAALVALAYFSLSQVENLYLLPRIIGRRIALHPVVVIVAALAGAQLGGVLGILLAAPAAASLRVLFGYAVHKLLDEDPFPQVAPVPEQEAHWRGRLRDRPIAALLLDLDGTLVEIDGEVVAKLAHRLAPLQQVLPRFQPEPAARRLLMIADLLVNEVVTLLSQLRLQRLVFKLYGWFPRVRGFTRPSGLVPVAGSLEALRLLAARYPLALVTSRSAYDAAAYLAQFGLGQLFQAVITRDDVHLLKPHPAPINLAAKRLGVQPAYCVLVGDTKADLRVAQASDVLMVGVLSGLGSEADLRSADLVISSVAELPCYLAAATEPIQQWVEAQNAAKLAE